MKILRSLRRLLPQRGAKVIPAAEMKKRLEAMKEKVKMSKNKKGK